jgi:hypothetical protein
LQDSRPPPVPSYNKQDPFSSSSSPRIAINKQLPCPRLPTCNYLKYEASSCTDRRELLQQGGSASVTRLVTRLLLLLANLDLDRNAQCPLKCVQFPPTLYISSRIQGVRDARLVRVSLFMGFVDVLRPSSLRPLRLSGRLLRFILVVLKNQITNSGVYGRFSFVWENYLITGHKLSGSFPVLL